MTIEKLKLLGYEVAWLLGIFLAAIAVEYAFFELFDINPIISAKIQGLLVLTVIGYGLRISYRIWKIFNQSDSPDNGMPDSGLDLEKQ